MGCKVNYYESESIYNSLKKFGEVTTDLEFANVYILNTCAVTNEAEHKSRGVIAKINKLNPNAKIYVMGCSAELHKDSFLTKPNVVAVLGTENKQKMVEIITKNETGDHIQPLSTTYLDNAKVSGERIRTFIKIQDGCNNFCTYCIIPYTRGRERSRTIESIENELKEVSKNSKEVVLVGINIAGYGKDLTPQKTLVDVVNLFKNYPEIRLRFSSFEMGVLSDNLLKTLAEMPNFCPFFHLALQSGDDNTLKKMNRKYTVCEYFKSLQKIKEYFPDATISTDIIVGFPTETEEDFNNSLNFVKKCNFAFMHIFPYSKRNGTVAEKWGMLNGEVVRQRVAQMTELANIKKQEFLTQNLGKTAEVLIENYQKGYLKGFTKGYLKCYIKSEDKSLINQVVKVKITDILEDGVTAELI